MRGDGQLDVVLLGGGLGGALTESCTLMVLAEMAEMAASLMMHPKQQKGSLELQEKTLS